MCLLNRIGDYNFNRGKIEANDLDFAKNKAIFFRTEANSAQYTPQSLKSIKNCSTMFALILIQKRVATKSQQTCSDLPENSFQSHLYKLCIAIRLCLLSTLLRSAVCHKLAQLSRRKIFRPIHENEATRIMAT